MGKLTKEQIHYIADSLDVGGEICYINRNTGEYIIMLNNEMLKDYGIYWEDPEEEEEDTEDIPNDEPLDWQTEMYNDVKANMDKIYSWGIDVIRIEKPAGHESFEIMERFVGEIIPQGKLKREFENALSRKHPFSNFNAIVHNCKYREDWFAFKMQALEEYVRKIIKRNGKKYNLNLILNYI
jgi:hypothetical protein